MKCYAASELENNDMCFFTATFLATSEKPWSKEIPDEMETAMFLQTFSSSGAHGLMAWLESGINLKKAKGFQAMLEHAINNSYGGEQQDYRVMLSIVNDFVSGKD